MEDKKDAIIPIVLLTLAVAQIVLILLKCLSVLTVSWLIIFIPLLVLAFFAVVTLIPAIIIVCRFIKAQEDDCMPVWDEDAFNEFNKGENSNENK